MEKFRKFKDSNEECVNFQPVNQSFINKYKDKVSPDLITFWQEIGLGSFTGGLFRLVCPDDYQYFVDNYIGDEGQFDSVTPFMITIFGDIFIWAHDIRINESYVGYINIRRGTWRIIASNINVLFNVRIISKSKFKMFDLINFPTIVTRLGLPEPDECYGYVPALTMGGSESLNNVQIVKTIPYVDFICQSLGKFEFRE